MVVGIIAIVGAIFTFLGIAMNAGWATGVGVLLLFFGFFVTSITAINIPTPMIIFGLILLVFIVVGRKK